MELTKLFREGTMTITTTGININDKVISCYTLDNDKEKYIVVKFSNGHVVAPVKNIQEIDTKEHPYNPFEWQYDLFNSDNEFLCSIIKYKEE